MRPPEFTGGKCRVAEFHQPDDWASMRPPEFTGGKKLDQDTEGLVADRASMRPPEFTGGKASRGGGGVLARVGLQ